MIIDFRARPPIPGFASYPTDPDRVRMLTERLGYRPPRALAERSIDTWLEEIREAGIDRVVVLGRATPMQFVPNDDISTFVRAHPESTIGFAAVDVVGVAHDPVEEIRRSIRELRLAGVTVDPGSALQRSPEKRAGIVLDDSAMMPIYQACVDLDVPLVVLTGPYGGNDLSFTDPARVDRVAAMFPNLKLICGHGCWPYAAEILAVAYKRGNVYVSPDLYLGMPGSQPYVEAMRHVSLHRQILFASCYPLRRFDDAVSQIEQLGLPAEFARDVLGGNAAKLLRLGESS